MLGIRRFGELPRVRRAHVIAWRKMLEARALGPATRCRKLSAVSSLFSWSGGASSSTIGMDRPLTRSLRPLGRMAP